MLYHPREFARVRNAALALSGLAWVLLVARTAAGSAHSHGHGAAGAADWFLMLAAMMTPVLAAPMDSIRRSSFARRRTRSTMLFAAGYFGVWMALGGLVLPLVSMVGHGARWPYAVGAFVAVVVWQCSPWKQVCLNRCHNQPAPAAFGWKADADALRFGATHGGWCIGSCGLMMLWPTLLDRGHLAAMALVSALIFCERLEHPQWPAWRLRGCGRAMRMLRTAR